MIFGFGFIMSLTFSAVVLPLPLPPPSPNRPRSLCSSGPQPGSDRRDLLQRVPCPSPVQLWVSEGCPFQGLSQAEEDILAPSTCAAPQHPEILPTMAYVSVP